MTKVYGVKGLMEWNALIPVGKSFLRVHFTDGSLSGYGVSPAVYRTSDEFTQQLIEGSDLFKRGKIYLVATYGDQPEKKENSVVSNLKEMEFSSYEAAKEYLAEEYEVSRVKMRSNVAVIEQGKAVGINIVIK